MYIHLKNVQCTAGYAGQRNNVLHSILYTRQSISTFSWTVAMDF